MKSMQEELVSPQYIKNNYHQKSDLTLQEMQVMSQLINFEIERSETCMGLARQMMKEVFIIPPFESQLYDNGYDPEIADVVSDIIEGAIQLLRVKNKNT